MDKSKAIHETTRSITNNYLRLVRVDSWMMLCHSSNDGNQVTIQKTFTTFIRKSDQTGVES